MYLSSLLPAYLHVYLCETSCNSFRDLHLSTVFKFLVLLEVGIRGGARHFGPGNRNVYRDMSWLVKAAGA